MSVSVQNNSYPNTPLAQEFTQMEKTILNLINKTLLLLTLWPREPIYWGRFGWEGARAEESQCLLAHTGRSPVPAPGRALETPKAL